MIKPGTDYSKSAIDLKNPIEVLEALLAWDKAEKQFKACYETFKNITNDLPEKAAIDIAATKVGLCLEDVRVCIKTHGGYQDITEGLYALRQGRKSVGYDVEKVKAEMPKYISAVIEETVDADALKALVKAKKVTEEQVNRCQVVTEPKAVADAKDN